MTTYLQTEIIEEGLSRRGLVRALAAAAAAASIATPSLAQSTAVAEATPTDYIRDPTRWGGAAWDVMERRPSTVADVIDAFRQHLGGPKRHVTVRGWLM